MINSETRKARGDRFKKLSRAKDADTQKGGNAPTEETSVIAGRVTRLIKLMRILEDSPKRMGSVELAKSLSISRRTLFRDLETLRAAGFKRASLLETGNGKTPNGGKRGIAFDHSEVIGLMLIGKIIKSLPEQPMFSAAMRAIEKVMEVIPTDSQDVYRELMEQVSVSPGAINVCGEDEEHYRTLQVSIDERRVCRALYDGVEPHGRTMTRIHPLHLHFHNRAWYVMAYSETHEEVRTFKLSRFMELERLRAYFPPMKFSLKDYLNDAWGIIPGEKKYDIALRFSAKVARNVSEVMWHHTQQTKRMANGGCEMRFKVNGLHEIRWWILGYGNECEVIEPAELREEIVRLASATAKKYANGIHGNGRNGG